MNAKAIELCRITRKAFGTYYLVRTVVTVCCNDTRLRTKLDLQEEEVFKEIPLWCLRRVNHIPLSYACVLYQPEHLSVPPRILEIYNSSLQPGNSLIHSFHQLLSVWGRRFCLFVCFTFGCKGIKNNTNFRQITGIQEKLGTTCK